MSHITESNPKKITAPHLRARKGGAPIVALTAYDYPTARLVDEAGFDFILVGDSLAQTVLGYDTTLPVTMEEMLHATRAVRRGTRRALIVGDMPFGTYQDNAGGAVKAAIEEDGMVVTARAPLGRLRADHVLHVLDGAAIPLVIERGEVVRRRIPLVVNLFVAARAILARHEKRRRDGAADVGFGARRKKGLLRPRAFLFHHERHHAGITIL